MVYQKLIVLGEEMECRGFVVIFDDFILNWLNVMWILCLEIFMQARLKDFFSVDLSTIKSP
jgi:hypothetical protein